MRIIFLDIDEVLNHVLTYPPCWPGWGRHQRGLDRHVPRVRGKTLVEKTGAQVVLSSVWRLSMGEAKTARVIRRQGFPGFKFIGVTPKGIPGSYRRVPRGLEIEWWLNDHWLHVEDMVHLSHRHVLTDIYNGGLTEAKVEEALKLFGL